MIYHHVTTYVIKNKWICRFPQQEVGNSLLFANDCSVKCCQAALEKT